MTPDDNNDPLIGTKIGPCRIEKRLAAGGMGVVYRAHHSPTDQDVAVKILAPSLAADHEYVTRFFREAGAAGQIDHPNVVRVIDVGKHEDKYYLIMEYVAGETLDATIDRERRLSLERATRLIRDIGSGLAAAHRAGIIHRDVKPGNVIVSRDGKPHLTDFGLARHSETRKGLTIEGTFLGTPEYASPEQVEGRRLDFRTDLYSLGITYFHLMAGTLPFLGESPMEIAIKRTKEEARPLENALPTADPRACAIVAKLLKSDPSQRYQSASELIKDLDAILMGQKPVSATVSDTTKKHAVAKISVAVKRRVRASIYWGLVTVGVLLALASGVLAARQGSWAAVDADRTARFMLLGAAVVAGLGAVFAYRREFGMSGRLLLLGLLTILMILGSLGTGILIDRGEASSTMATLASSARALAGHAVAPVNLFALGLLGLLIGAVISFEHEPGETRVWVSRLAVLAAFGCFYALGAATGGWAAPFRLITREAELSIPLATATLLAGFFGTLMLTGYDFEKTARTCGLLLCVATAAGLYAFPVLVGQPDRHGWLKLLAEPFADFGRSFTRSGTPLVGVLMLAVAVKAIVAAGIRKQDRFYSKKR